MTQLTGRQLIELLQNQSLDLPVFIQQGEEHDFIAAMSVKTKILHDPDLPDAEAAFVAIVIKYQ